ncbi:MAG: hypothetical protein JWM93_872 [Frankiales bacterium]|nr:hypothetical protein [Frankiales bacterium]
MTLDERLRDAFAAKAASAAPSPEAWDLIRERTRRSGRIRFVQAFAVGTAFAAAAVGVLVLSHVNGGERQSVATTPPTLSRTTDDPSPTESVPVVAPTAPATVTTTGPIVDASTAIAVAMHDGRINLVSADGSSTETLVTQQDRYVTSLAWGPGRRELYVSSVVANGCSAQTLAIDVTTKVQRVVGSWSEVAFTTDGKRLAAVVSTPTVAGSSSPDCGTSLVVQNVAEPLQPRSLDIGAGDSAGQGPLISLVSLVWVPGANRLMYFDTDLGGNNPTVRVLDLDSATSLADARTLRTSLDASHVIHSMRFVGSRLLVSTRCCAQGLESASVVELDTRTGDVTELWRVDGDTNWHSLSPDGQRLLFTTNAADGNGGDVGTVGRDGVRHQLGLSGAVAAVW